MLHSAQNADIAIRLPNEAYIIGSHVTKVDKPLVCNIQASPFLEG
jgi:hypothetical protein